MTADALVLLAANPLVPAGWEGLAAGIGLLPLALTVWALVETYRAPALAMAWKVLCVLLAVFVPFVGAVAVVVVTRLHRARVSSGELALTVMAPPRNS